MHKIQIWPSKENELRHNHETFPALSLFRAARYFDSFAELPDTAIWLQEAEKVFSGPIGKVFKHEENSASYQWILPSHKFIYDIASGKRETIKNKIILKTAQAALISVDNFGYATDYGNDGCPIRNGGSIIILFDLFASEFEDETLSWTAEHMRAALPNSSSTHFPHPGWGGCALHRDLKQKRTNCGDLELLELDGHILKKHAPEMIGMNILDKIGYRGGEPHPFRYERCFAV